MYTRDGAEYAVTFKVFSDESPDQKDLALIPIFIGNGIWEIDGIDIREFKDLSDRYGQNRNPFEDLTFNLRHDTSSPASNGFGSLN